MADTWANDLMTHFIIPMGISRPDNKQFHKCHHATESDEKINLILIKTMDWGFVRQTISMLIDFWVS